MYTKKGILEFITLAECIAINQNALRHFYQSALLHEQLENAF